MLAIFICWVDNIDNLERGGKWEKVIKEVLCESIWNNSKKIKIQICLSQAHIKANYMLIRDYNYITLFKLSLENASLGLKKIRENFIMRGMKFVIQLFIFVIEPSELVFYSFSRFLSTSYTNVLENPKYPALAQLLCIAQKVWALPNIFVFSQVNCHAMNYALKISTFCIKYE